MKKINFYILIVPFLLLTKTSFAQQVPSYKYYVPELWKTYLDIDQFNTSSNYDDGGAIYDDPRPEHSFTVTSAHLGTRWTPNRDFGFFTQASYSQAESNDGDYVRSNSGLSNLTLGADYLMYKDLINLIPEVSFSLPITTIDTEGDSALINDGAATFQIRLIMNKSYLMTRNHFYLGFRYREEGLSSLATWGFGTRFKHQFFGYGIQIDGYNSITEDSYSDTPTDRTDFIDQVNAGSLRFYSVDPNLIEGKLFIGFFYKDDLALEGGLTSTLQGTNTAQGIAYFISFRFNILPLSYREKRELNLVEKAQALKQRQKALEQKRGEEFVEKNFIPVGGKIIDEEIIHPSKHKEIDELIEELD